jgi:hypothetical protein
MINRFSVGLAAGSVLAGALALVVAANGLSVGGSGQRMGLQSSARAAAQQEPGSTGESIEVHGHWVIEIRNPDGSVVSRTEFENALTNQGADALARIVAGRWAVGQWRVKLEDAAVGSGPCNGTCFIAESVEPDVWCNTGCFKNLSVLAVNGEVVFSGYATALDDGTVEQVGTVAAFCEMDQTQGSCLQEITDLEAYLTATTLPSPIAVISGQSIVVTVTFSFS